MSLHTKPHLPFDNKLNTLYLVENPHHNFHLHIQYKQVLYLL